MPRARCGFTLIEVAITMAIVSIALLSYLLSNTAIQQSNRSAFERSIALQDANQVIERMRNMSSNGQFPGNVTSVYSNNGVVQGFTNLPNEQVIVSYSSVSPNLLDITVTVSWLANGNRQTNTDLRTLLTQRVV